jgi:RHS repeat-associated protein
MAGTPTSVDWRSNRLSTSFVYDDAGNVIEMPDRRTLDPPVPNAKITFQFDALRTMANVDGTRLGRAFVYDASEERVGIIDYKAEGGRRETWSIRSQTKQVIRDFEQTFDSTGGQWRWTKDYVHRGSILTNTVAPGPTGVRDVHTDHLGSVRFLTDGQGNLVLGEGQTTSGNRFWPFGGLVFKRALSERIAFTGHERDDDGRSGDEADFDYMHARYYMASFGRFLSVDPGTAAADDPQSWNAYSYVVNNPMSAIDPDGRETLVINPPRPASLARWTPTEVAFENMKNLQASIRASRGELTHTTPVRSSSFGPSVRATTPIPPDFHVDHMQDLQLGGTSTPDNAWGVPARVNTSNGARVAAGLRNTPKGAPITKIVWTRLKPTGTAFGVAGFALDAFRILANSDAYESYAAGYEKFWGEELYGYPKRNIGLFSTWYMQGMPSTYECVSCEIYGKTNAWMMSGGTINF